MRTAVSAWNDPRRWVDRARDVWAAIGEWWRSPGFQRELRAAWIDIRRAPALYLGSVLAFLVVWVWLNHRWMTIAIPVAVALGFLLLVRLVLFLVVPWGLRNRARRWVQPAATTVAATGAIIWLLLIAGIVPLGIALGLLVLVLDLTQEARYRARVYSVLVTRLSSAMHLPAGALEVQGGRWTGRKLESAEIAYGAELAAHDARRRDQVASILAWVLRGTGVSYDVTWLDDRPAFVIRAAAELPTQVYEQAWSPEFPALPIGVCDEDSADAFFEERTADAHTEVRLPIRTWNPADERNWLIIGAIGSGKTVFLRGLIARALRLGWFPGGAWVLDGKSSADYAALLGRKGIQAIARTAEEWAAALMQVQQLMEQRYEEDWRYQSQQTDQKPDHPRMLLVIEECQQIRAMLGDQADAFFSQLARQARGANIRIIFSTQRPDAKDSIPGAVKDQLENVAVMGYVSRRGAEMALGEDWRVATDAYGADMPKGRGVVKIAGKLGRLQAFRLDLPREMPYIEYLYPPEIGSERGPETSFGFVGPLPPGTEEPVRRDEISDSSEKSSGSAEQDSGSDIPETSEKDASAAATASTSESAPGAKSADERPVFRRRASD